jgi:hypothetical protein
MPARTSSRPARKASRRTPSRPAPRTTGRPASAGPRWSRHVMETSDAMDLDPGLFKKRSPAAIAAGLKRSAERSRRRKAGPFQSAMSMLNFYINRGGRNLTAAQKARLEKAKGELRALFGRE